MNGIKLAETLIRNRHKKGITQEELAEFIGVSKAAVSKWETEQSFPDISFLPQLASFFGITIDELLNYEANLSDSVIKSIQMELTKSFAEKGCETALKECHEYVHKFHSCYTLLYQIALLYINHFMLFPKEEDQKSLITEAKELCIRIKTESSNILLARRAISIEALCDLFLEKPDEILDLLGEEVQTRFGDENLIAKAYKQLGNEAKAKELFQVNTFQDLMALMSSMLSLLGNNIDDEKASYEIIKRTECIVDTFNICSLHRNSAAQFYYSAAIVYCSYGKIDESIKMLKKYASVCDKDFFPLKVHTDSFFDSIDKWLEQLFVTSGYPRDEKIIKHSIVDSLEKNNAFDRFKGNKDFQEIISSLKEIHNIREENL